MSKQFKWKGVTRLVLTREQYCAFIREIYEQGYVAHHKALCPRPQPIGRDREAVAAFAEPYDGKFGKGIKVIVPRRIIRCNGNDTVIYYIKSN